MTLPTTPVAHARTTDPSTSHEAAASAADITRLQANVLALFHFAGSMTDGDLLDLYRQMVDGGNYPPASDSGIRSRRHELVVMARLVDTGDRVRNFTRRNQIVWGLAPGTTPRRTSFALVPRSRAATRGVLEEVLGERIAQDRKWGPQNHPDGTGTAGWVNEARDARNACQEAAARGEVTWLDIAFEEIAEAFAEDRADLLRAELIQAAAVLVAWVEALDRRPS